MFIKIVKPCQNPFLYVYYIYIIVFNVILTRDFQYSKLIQIQKYIFSNRNFLTYHQKNTEHRDLLLDSGSLA